MKTLEQNENSAQIDKKYRNNEKNNWKMEENHGTIEKKT